MLTLPMLWMLEGQLGPAGTGSWGTRVTARGMHHGDSFFLLRTPQPLSCQFGRPQFTSRGVHSLFCESQLCPVTGGRLG